MMYNSRIPILIAEDDEDDRLLYKEALSELGIKNPVFFVGDGLELLQHLDDSADDNNPEHPGILLMDLNMPKVDGREALAKIKQKSEPSTFPIVVLTTSQSQQDIQLVYALGANTFISKPRDFDELTRALKDIFHYWFEVASLPNEDKPCRPQ